jgi:hypothetical protein
MTQHPIPAPKPDAAERGWSVCEDYCAELAGDEVLDDDGFIDAALIHDVIAVLLARGHVRIAADPEATDHVC